MLLPLKFSGVFISVKQTESVDQNGQRFFRNYVALDANGEVGNVQCVSKVVNELNQIPKYSEVEFKADYDSWKKELVIKEVIKV